MRALWTLAAISAACGSVTEPAAIDATTVDAVVDAGPFMPTTSSYVKASNTDAADGFGGSVAVSADGSTMVVAASSEDSIATGVGGNAADNTALGAGAVYVLVRSPSGWVHQAYLKASNTEASDTFGIGLAISEDGNTVVVGASGEDSAATTINGAQGSNTALGAGAVYVFTRTGMVWTQQAYLKAFNAGAGDQFGVSVALAGDGNTLAVGANGEDSAGVNPADDTASSAGAAYIFSRIGLTWTQQAYLKASNVEAGDQFGLPVALSRDGNIVAVGASSEDSASPGVGGNQADNTAANSGAAYLFTRAGTTWAQTTYLKASNPDANDSFGRFLAISGDATTLAVSAFAEDSAAGSGGDQTNNSALTSGAVYVFASAAMTWTQQAYLKGSNTEAGDQFGFSVALSEDGNTLAGAAAQEDSAAIGFDSLETDNSASGAGAVYVLTRLGTTWTQRSYLKASNTEAADQFGRVVGLSATGTTLVVSATGEDSTAIGVGGNQADNTAVASGAAYVIE